MGINMDKNIALVRKIIRQHLKTQKVSDEYINALEIKFIDDFKQAVVKEEKDRIKEDARKELEKEEQIRNIRKTKIFLFETLILGFLVGLLVNQGTDIISFLKGQLSNMNKLGTALSVLGLLLVIVCFILLSYLNLLEQLVVKRRGKSDGGSI